MNGIKFIEPTQKMEFEQKEYLIANYDIANKLFSSKEIPYFAFDFALEPISTVWIQTLEINQDTQAFTFVDYMELDNSKLKSNYFESYINLVEILKGLYRIVFKNSSSEIYKVSYNLLNYYQFVIPQFFFQELFSENIDFDNKIIPDSVGSFDAEIINSSSIISTGNNIRVLFDRTRIIDFNQPFTVISRGSNPTGSFRIIWSDNLYFTFAIFNGEIVQVKINGSVVHSFTSSARFFRQIGTTILRREAGGVFSVWFNGIKITEFTKTTTIVQQSDLQMYFTTSGSETVRTNALSIINSALSDVEIVEIGNSFDIIIETAILKNPSSFFWGFAESSGSIVFDIISGEEGLFDGTFEVGKFNSFSNLLYGFDIYILDSDPTKKIYVPLKYDGTSFAKVISGYTFVETVTQNGNEFLNCETKLLQPNVQPLKDLDTYNLYFDILGEPIEVDFETLHNYSQDNVEMTKTDNKITNLKLKL